MVVKAAAVILLVLCCTNEDMVVPFICEIPYIRDGNVDTLVFRAFDERRKAVMIFPYIDELPMVFFTDGAKVIQILRLKRSVIFAGVTARRKFVGKIFFEFFDFSHELISLV